MKKIIFSGFLFVFCYAVEAQKKDASIVKFANTITQDDLKRHLLVIASDSMEGRYTGKPGQKKAAQYIANHFKNLGLQAPVKTEQGMSYLQEFQMVGLKWKEVYIKVGEDKLTFLKDVFVLKHSNLKEETEMSVVFAGMGTAEDFKNLDVKDKAVVCFKSEKEDEDKAKLAREKGAKAIIFISGTSQKEFDEASEYYGYNLKRNIRALSSKNRPENALFYVSIAAASKILNVTESELISKKSQPNALSAQSIRIKAERTEEVAFSSENVLGFLEGTDKKEEILVITAHYDHVGVNGGEVYNGADDDGSGTVAVMELAEAFVKAKKEGNGPRRSILFMTVAGEELGLYGSQYYCDIEPIFPLANTVANLNIDMIGRIGGDYIAKNDPNYVYLIGSDKLSSELHNLSESVNQKFIKLKLDYKYNDENDPNRFYYRSDHYNFAKNNIPIIFYFNGVHEDYHQPTDEVSKIHFPKLEKIARLVFHTAWEITHQNNRLKVDK